MEEQKDNYQMSMIKEVDDEQIGSYHAQILDLDKEGNKDDLNVKEMLVSLRKEDLILEEDEEEKESPRQHLKKLKIQVPY